MGSRVRISPWKPIVSIADVFDALTTARPYKSPWSNEEAIAYIEDQAGTMFNPAVVESFLRVLPEIQRDQLRFLDDIRGLWTERRREIRHTVRPVPIALEVAMPEQTFRPMQIQGVVRDISASGLRVLLSNVPLDLFSILVASRRYAKLICLDPDCDGLHQAFCGVAWIDYYAVPDPNSCLMGLSFQKTSPELTVTIQKLTGIPA